MADSDTAVAPESQSAEPATPPTPAVPAPVKARPSAPSRPVEPSREQALEMLGLDQDKLAAFEKWQTEWEAKRPEIERTRSELGRAQKAIAETQSKIAAYEKQVKEMTEMNFALHLSHEASEVGRLANVHAEAGEDLYVWLDRHTEAEMRDGETVVTFRDGKTEIDLSESDARRKLAEHVAKAKPHWVRPQMAQTGGAGRPASVPGGKVEPPKDRAGLAAHMAQRLLNGGNGAAVSPIFGRR